MGATRPFSKTGKEMHTKNLIINILNSALNKHVRLRGSTEKLPIKESNSLQTNKAQETKATGQTTKTRTQKTIKQTPKTPMPPAGFKQKDLVF